MTALIRAAALTHFAEVAAQFGLDAAQLLRDAGLPQRCLAEPDLKVSALAVTKLLEQAAERAREPAFALHMVRSRRLSNLGPLGLLVRDVPTLRSALEVLAGHIHLHNEALSVRVEETGGLVLLRLELQAPGAGSLRQATELALGVTYRVLQLFLGSGWRPRLVCFRHRAPRQRATHHDIFGPAVEFGHEFDGLVCNASALDAPNPAADAVMARYTQQLLGTGTGHRAEDTLAQRVQQLTVLLLPRGHCRVDVVAQHLGVDRRTVARRLAAEGSSFSELVNAQRIELVGRYLRDGSRPLGEVAALLGFSAPSAFTRWHRQVFGVAPTRALAGSVPPAAPSSWRRYSARGR